MQIQLPELKQRSNKLIQFEQIQSNSEKELNLLKIPKSLNDIDSKNQIFDSNSQKTNLKCDDPLSSKQKIIKYSCEGFTDFIKRIEVDRTQLLESQKQKNLKVDSNIFINSSKKSVNHHYSVIQTNKKEHQTKDQSISPINMKNLFQTPINQINFSKDFPLNLKKQYSNIK